MTLLRGLNDERELTVVMVTHEPDIAAFARRTIHFVDGLVQSDRPNPEAARC
jgi:putative ABC transport system ATP-binding protein